MVCTVLPTRTWNSTTMIVLMITNAETVHRGAWVWNTTHTGSSSASTRYCMYSAPDSAVYATNGRSRSAVNGDSSRAPGSGSYFGSRPSTATPARQVTALPRNRARYAVTVLISIATPAVAMPSDMPRLSIAVICDRNVVASRPPTRRSSATFAVVEELSAIPSTVVTSRNDTKLCARNTYPAAAAPSTNNVTRYTSRGPSRSASRPIGIVAARLTSPAIVMARPVRAAVRCTTLMPYSVSAVKISPVPYTLISTASRYTR